MVPFYGTVYKSSLYDLIIPFPACESGAEREKDMRLFLRPGKPEKANNLIINFLWIVVYMKWHQLYCHPPGVGINDKNRLVESIKQDAVCRFPTDTFDGKQFFPQSPDIR